jgi:hypothetical protein
MNHEGTKSTKDHEARTWIPGARVVSAGEADEYRLFVNLRVLRAFVVSFLSVRDGS